MAKALHLAVRVTRQQNDNSPLPAIVSMPGSGETGTNTDNLVKFGPHHWLLKGWDGSVKLGNGTHYPILITLEQPAQNMRPWHLKALMQIVLKIFPIKAGSVQGDTSLATATAPANPVKPSPRLRR